MAPGSTSSSSASSARPRVSGTCVMTKISAIRPMAANRKNTPVIPIPSTSEGKNSARNPFVVHPKSTAMPIPRPRMCSGKISATPRAAHGGVEVPPQPPPHRNVEEGLHREDEGHHEEQQNIRPQRIPDRQQHGCDSDEPVTGRG